ncbi:beta-lactam resistance family protein [Escherichia coli]|nr:beta-lactam resistance family protein [Escherichia coli]
MLELLLLSNIYPLKLMDQSREMWAVMNRLIELTGWIVLVVSAILLGVASHIDNYQPPEQSASVQHK